MILSKENRPGAHRQGAQYKTNIFLTGKQPRRPGGELHFLRTYQISDFKL